jgi:hypothetical protein
VPVELTVFSSFQANITAYRHKMAEELIFHTILNSDGMPDAPFHAGTQHLAEKAGGEDLDPASDAKRQALSLDENDLLLQELLSDDGDNVAGDSLPLHLSPPPVLDDSFIRSLAYVLGSDDSDFDSECLPPIGNGEVEKDEEDEMAMAMDADVSEGDRKQQECATEAAGRLLLPVPAPRPGQGS